jgi:hypothetical protein
MNPDAFWLFIAGGLELPASRGVASCGDAPMPRFYFDLVAGEDEFRDEEGLEFSDASEATILRFQILLDLVKASAGPSQLEGAFQARSVRIHGIMLSIRNDPDTGYSGV